jgi:predicted TIM-barrel fold metal-dependent hydrolase
MAKKPYVIALEEHYQDPEVKQLGAGPGAGREIVERLDDLGALRIREMDEAGIDFQVLSHSIPGLQAVDAEAGPPLARRTNDRLYEAVQRHPDRFSAFAVLPTANPRAAADELERAVTRLGFKGAMVNGMTNGVFHDDKRFWPIWERRPNWTCRFISILPCRTLRSSRPITKTTCNRIPASCVLPGASRLRPPPRGCASS